jgi:hypothetical protein
MLLEYQEYHLIPSCSHQGSTAHQLHKPHYGVMGERAVTTCGIDDDGPFIRCQAREQKEEQLMTCCRRTYRYI